MMAAILGIQPETPCWDNVQKDECKSLQEFYRRVDKIMRLETAREAVQVFAILRYISAPQVHMSQSSNKVIE